MTSIEIDKLLSNFTEDQKVLVLLAYGHELTISARDGYEVQGDSLTKPRLLREINEIMHRIFPAINEIQTKSVERFSLSSICHWISCEDRNTDLQKESINCFKRALNRCKELNT